MLKHKLGISIYPEHQSEEEIREYLKKASKIGYTKIFSSLLEVNENNKKSILKKFKSIFDYANKLNYEITLDVAPDVFKILNIKLPDTSFFDDFFVDVLRFDEGTNEMFESSISQNSNIKIEINISTKKDYAINLLKSNANFKNIIGSHNFYPQKYTGLDFYHFKEMTKFYKILNIRTSAFVTSQNSQKTFGPWKVNEGLCTLEKHRNLPIDVQAIELLNTNLIDDIIIGNYPATDNELKLLFDAVDEYKNEETKSKITLKIYENITKIEEKILFEFKNHFKRGDINSYFIRSTFSRIEYKNEEIKPRIFNSKPQLPGEIYVLNDNYGKYKGEVHIILKELPFDNGKNLVGKVKNFDDILNLIPWEEFEFIL